MIVYMDSKRTLHAEGSQDETTPLVLRAVCNGCGQELSRRIYQTTDEIDHIPQDAAQDAKAVKRHRCPA